MLKRWLTQGIGLGGMLLGLALAVRADTVERDLPYGQTAATESDLRRLNYYRPERPGAYPLLIWFHGGSLTGGSKDDAGSVAVATRWMEQGVGVVDVNYRLSPQTRYPGYVEDAALAVAWALQEGVLRGADAKRIYVGGYSAGAYLALLLALDERHLRAVGVEPAHLAGFVALSGQASTHFTVKRERGVVEDFVVVDEAAPLGHVRKGVPRLLLITGDRDWPARAEENRYLAAALTQVAKNENVAYFQARERDHGSLWGQFLTPGDAAGARALAWVFEPHSLVERVQP